MNYIDTYQNKELKQYFKILSKEYPSFIDPYIKTNALQRLCGIGQFCGCDYTKIHHCKYWFSRLEHSIACALMAWHFTQDKSQTLAMLFHDLGTPAFSHCIDFLLNDALNQESSEKNIKEVLLGSNEIMALLKKDHIDIEEVTNINQYPIIENEKPQICIDRLEGIIGTCLIWYPIWDLAHFEEIYQDLTILINEKNHCELGFQTIEKANLFFEGVFHYSIILQQNEDKFTLQFIADCLKELIKNKQLALDDLYLYSEQKIINIIRNNEKLKLKWQIFENAKNLKKSNNKPNGYYVMVNAKKRYVVPLVLHQAKAIRLNQVSSTCQKQLQAYLEYQDSIYAYLEKI